MMQIWFVVLFSGLPIPASLAKQITYNYKQCNRMYQPGVNSGFGGFEKGPKYEDPLTRKKFCEEAEKYMCSFSRDDTIIMLRNDVLSEEAKKWLCTSFTQEQSFKTKDWNGFVSMF